jgi:hypothetical protein
MVRTSGTQHQPQKQDRNDDRPPRRSPQKFFSQICRSFRFYGAQSKSKGKNGPSWRSHHPRTGSHETPLRARIAFSASLKEPKGDKKAGPRRLKNMPKVGFSSHPHENKHITSKQAHLAYRNKELTYFSFLQFFKTKELRPTHFAAQRFEMHPLLVVDAPNTDRPGRMLSSSQVAIAWLPVRQPELETRKSLLLQSLDQSVEDDPLLRVTV